MTGDLGPTFAGIEGPYGLRVTDPIEGAGFTLLTRGPVSPSPADPDEFALPVDAAATVAVSKLETPYQLDVLVRDADANVVAECVSGDEAAFDPGEYYVEVLSAKMKLYLRADAAVEITPGEDRVRIGFGGPTRVAVGARSFHERPAATVETTTAPEDLATALSQLGSALKTTSPERSFPTLRGHPPLIECGPELSVPDELEPPDTGITIRVPPRLDALFPVASLAYYLGARVEVGDEPRVLADGADVGLAHGGDLETGVARLLRRTFLLDCVTRTEGLYDFDLHERRLVEPAVDLEFDRLYDLSPDERLREYLTVDHETIAEAIPTWKLTADVVPDFDHVSALPFLADELAVVRCPTDPVVGEEAETLSPEVRSFFGRGAGEGAGTSVRGGATVRGTRAAEADTPDLNDTVIQLDDADSIEQTYVGDGIPLGASRMTPEEYYRRLDFDAAEDGRIRVQVVCNDAEMRDENAVSEIYGTREWIEFDIATHDRLTTDEMRAVLAEEADFLHYIGHVDDMGIRCADGHLDARDLSEVNVSAFLLNACTSYQQGRALVEAGARGGIVTLTDVLNPTATEIGRTVARFLNSGFSLLSMLDLVKKRNSLAHWYVVVGDGNATLVESESGMPNSVEIGRGRRSDFHVTVTGYPSKGYQIGTVFRPHLTKSSTRYLNSGELDQFVADREQVREFFEMQDVPVIVDRNLYWSNELDLDDV